MKASTLKRKVKKDLQERNILHDIDLHVIDIYCQLVQQFHELAEDIATRGVQYIDERGVERANPSLRAQSALASQITQYAKMLGIAPYGRRLTTGGEQQKDKPEDPAASLLRPILSKRRQAK